ncbi:transglutaminaseTgpA domain-containing protein [Arthrobacter caoxuetaonis]|uniref:DUF3488 and transglutaminase-like domain-containing protein n=1 Tax=Arthrobacter caoxuetaonis TaxID=2886935 RepID=A0A9X1ME36_9MICC|nr:DUF3488 and transglutaminase-like domain-containing protein [Arthrobacter caoxuetaonis]MCC3297277.1 DUF3488 and transglutaminase-like domain-containing protein [Arthrobacter caoxuetaonis]USQ58169.1 DUF3488 and transglutaminase-like domain-containing protein [Arthrobacter caoxuetaonis]
MTATATRPRQRPQDPGTRRPRTGSAQLMTSAAAAAAVLLCAFSVQGVLEGLAWMWPLAFIVVAVSTSMAFARYLLLPTVLVPAAGLVVLAMSLTLVFSSEDSFLGVIPTAATLARAETLLAEAQSVVITQVIPVVPDAGVVFIACLAIGLVTVLVDTLAVTLRMPAASGLGLLTILLVPAIIKPQSVGAAGFAAAASGFLLVLAAGVWEERAAGTGRTVNRTKDGTKNRPSNAHAAGALGIGAGAVLAALLVPLAIPGFNTGAFPQGARMDFFAGATGLNPVVTLGNDLRQPTATGRITYATDSTRPLYLRSTTLEDFSGSRWAPDTRSEERRVGTGAMIPREPAGPEIETTVTTTLIASQSYASPWLLAPYSPSSISGAAGAWTWDPSTMTLLSADGSAQGQSGYEVRSSVPTVTSERLSAVQPAPADAVDGIFTELPDDLPQIIRDTAREAASGKDTPYDQALALQSFLRGPQFSYSLDAPVEGGYDGNGMDVLARFLEQRSGYCVHFASAMAVMAREVGIPSRMGLGYAPGRSTNQTAAGPDGQELDEYAVDSRDAHAWPELYFEGVGWVRFEPTPSRGVVPTYAIPRQANAASAIQADNDPRGLGAAIPAPAPSSPAPGPETVPEEPVETGGAPVAGVGIAVLVAAAAVLAPWALRRRRTRLRRSTHGSSGGARLAWAEATDLGQDYGYHAMTADTPRSYADRLVTEAGLTGTAAAALQRLRRAYETEAYAAPAPRSGTGTGTGTGTGAGSAQRVATVQSTWSDVESVARALGASAPLGTRLRAMFFPASLGRARRR